MKPETVERLAEQVGRAGRNHHTSLREYWAILDRNRAKVNRAIECGAISFEAADTAWRAGYAKGGAL